MRPRRRCLVPALVAVAVAVSGAAGCGDDGDDVIPYDCSTEPRAEPFVPGMQQVGAGGTSFTLVSSEPSPPIRDDNRWELQIGDGGAFTGAVEVVPFMPDHRHGTPIAPVVTPVAGSPGRFVADPVNLWMPGLWDVTVRATPAGGVRDEVVFRLCIDG